MRKLVEKSLFFLLAFVICFETVLAAPVSCEYPQLDMTLTYYDGQDKPSISYSNWAQSDWYVNLLAVKLGQHKYAEDEVRIDQNLYRQFQGDTCPDKMYVCEYTEWSAQLPSLLSLGQDIAGVLALIPALFGADTLGFSDEMLEEGWSLFTLGKSELYVMNYESYENHEYRIYEGGLVSDDLDMAYMEGYEGCNGDGGGLWWLLGGVCGILWSAIDGVIGETIIGDGIDVLFYKNFTCKKANYQGENSTVDVNCSFLTTKTHEYQTYVSEYSSCGDDSCRANAVSKLNRKQSELEALCKKVLRNYEYNETQTECINNCISLRKTLNKYKEGTDLHMDFEDTDSNSCRFSDRMAAWLMRIVSWVRYIVPAIIIILTILDFIKAIAADSEDEIKKVSGRFVKRLIVAVIIFLLPLILEFLLGIFDISTNNYCLK